MQTEEIIVEIRKEIDEMKSAMHVANIRINQNEAELMTARGKIMITKGELLSTRGELLLTKAENIMMNQTILKLQDELDVKKNPPFSHICAAHYLSFTQQTGTITFTSLFYSSTNIDGSGFNLPRGTFPSG